MRRLHPTLAFLLLFLTTGISGQTLEQELTTLFNQGNYPGFAVGIVKDQELVYEGYFGLSDIVNNTEVTEETTYMLASMSKHFTHCAVNIAWESGDIGSLQDPISDYLPFDVVNPNFPAEEITIAMLLDHYSGISDNWDFMPYLDSDDQAIPLADYMEDYFTPGSTLYDASLNFYNEEVGSTYHYSNIGYALAALVVEEATNMPFYQFVEEQIFDDMCMSNTSYFLDDLTFSNVAIPYRKTGANFTPIGHYSYSDYPAGRMRSTLKDLGNYAIAMLNDGTMDEQELMSPAYSNFLNWGHGGGDSGVRTSLNLNKPGDYATIVLTNCEEDANAIMNILEDHLSDFTFTTPTTLDCLTTGVNQLSESKTFSAYPNPVNTILTIEFPYAIDLSTASVTNTIGQHFSLDIISSNSREYAFNTEKLAPGIYTLSLVDEGGTQYTGVFVKE